MNALYHCMLGLLLFTPAALLHAADQVSPTANISPNAQMQQNTSMLGFAIHGGAGTIDRDTMTAEKETEYRAGLEQALRTGYEILQRGGRSLDAVEAAV